MYFVTIEQKNMCDAEQLIIYCTTHDEAMTLAHELAEENNETAVVLAITARVFPIALCDYATLNTGYSSIYIS